MSSDGGSVPEQSGGGPAVGVPTTRLRLDLAYDGTGFSGWAVQPGRRTVAGVLCDALSLLFRRPVPLVVAGRTDAGVHAGGQVAHIDVDRAALDALAPRHLTGRAASTADRDTRTDDAAAGRIGLLRRLAGLLPADVRVTAVAAAPDGFDARFSALRRHYRYRIGTAPWGVSPLDRFDVLAHRRPLDAQTMQRAAATLIGLQDFATFCKPRPGATTIRELQDLSVTATSEFEVDITVTADAFCHSMVRSLVGVLLAVGEGRLEVSEPAALLAARRRTAAVHTAPARGLTLVGVDYPPDSQLAARAAATRALRTDGAGNDSGRRTRGGGTAGPIGRK